MLFRHTFKTACRDAGIGEEVHDALTSHVGEGVGRSYGDVTLKAMHQAMMRLEYPDFHLDWVWSPSDADRDRPPGQTPRNRKAKGKG